jgi:hypothetical protein
MDNGAYPKARTIIFSVHTLLTFKDDNQDEKQNTYYRCSCSAADVLIMLFGGKSPIKLSDCYILS